MSSVTPKLALLALASSALAVPYAGHGHNKHHHLHASSGIPSGSGPGPYGFGNATGIWGTGTAPSSGFTGATGIANPSPVGPETDSPVAQVNAVSTSSCTTPSVVSVTKTNRVTITVPPSSSVEAAAVSDTSAPLMERGFDAHFHRKAAYEAASSSSAAASSSDSVASAAYDASSSTPASSTATTSATSTSTSSGKRGVAYNDATLTTIFEDATEVTWGYNWGQASSGLSSSFNYVPLLWGTASTFTDDWSDAATDAISSGATHLMSFNEPDLSTQSDLSATEAATAYKTYMMPFAEKAKLGAPAVTNGAGAMGLDWLDAFITACDDCQIDFVAIHWYDSASNTAYFKEQVKNASDISGGLPVWVTEFGCTSGTDAEISSFLEEVMPWMDSQDYVERYSYFMVGDGYLLSGDALSTYGETYKSYTSSS